MIKKIWISFIGESGRFINTPNGPGSMSEWMKNINQNFHQYSSNKTEIIDYFGSNGNFVLSSAITNDNQITDFFCSCTGYNAVLLNLSHVYWLIQEICSISNGKYRKSSLWNIGAAFQLKGTKRYFGEFHVGQNKIWCIERGVASINRNIFPKSDKEVRPKWLKISKGISAKLGGDWTARSLPMINGVFECALLYLSKRR